MKPLLSIKKMKCSPGPPHLERSSPSQLFASTRHTPLDPPLFSSVALCHITATRMAGSYLKGEPLICPPTQGVGPVPAGLAGDLGRRGGLVGV